MQLYTGKYLGGGGMKFIHFLSHVHVRICIDQ